jgi:hypothetical protein
MDLRPEPPAKPEWSDEREEEDGPIGIFPSWRSLYFSVLVYTVALVIVLQVFTDALNHSVP